MKNNSSTRRSLLCGALALPALAWSSPAKLKVVASFSILGDLVREVGGDTVDVVSLVGPDADAHVFEPSPQDARKLQQARVLVRNGLGFEGWMKRLRTASGFRGVDVLASRGIKPRSFDKDAHEPKGEGAGHHHHHHAEDPHAWQDVLNVVTYVRNIAAGLADADPANAAHYRERAVAYAKRLDTLDGHIRRSISGLPADRRTAVTNHDAFGYYARAYGIRLVPARGLSTDAEPSAREIAQLIDQIRKERIQAVFVENISDPRLMEQLKRETGAQIGDKLYSDALSPPGGLAGSYVALMEANTSAFVRALQPR